MKSKLWAAPPGGPPTAWPGTAVARRVQVVGGSTTGSLVAGSTSRYTPFGSWRTEPTANLTDRGFTGHMHNNLGSGAEDIGLVYMAARWYAPTLGRFISADTLIPDPANPESYNRYSYVQNRPLDRIDPTGHVDCSLLDGGADTQACNEGKTNAAVLSTPCLDCGWSNQFGDMGKAYGVLTGLEQELGRPITYTEVLALVAHHEFGRDLQFDQQQYDVTLEAMGRQFYNFCDTGVCHGDELWKFLGAQQAWYDGDPTVFAQELTSGTIPEISFAGAKRVLEQPAYNPNTATVAEMRANWRSAANVSGVPFKYGNYSMFSNSVAEQLAVVPAGINGPSVDTVYLNRPDLHGGYVVMTVGQYNHWTDQ